MSGEKKVYILGAGCSQSCGFPLGPDVATRMKDWMQTLDPGLAARLIKAARSTLSLIGGTTDTVDTLVNKIDAGHLDESSAIMGQEMILKYQLREKRVYEAKVVIMAFFQSLEADAIETGLKRYREFLNDIFPGAGSNWIADRFSKEPVVVMSFNYDRLFELAFQDRFNVNLEEWGFYGQKFLNSGLDVIYNSRVEFTDDCFSFLKLHGSVGMWVGRSWLGEGAEHLFDSPVCDRNWKPTDKMYFPDSNRHREPLIVFPHERQAIIRDERKGLSQQYVQKVWAQAQKVISAATQITVIGYSFQGIDRGPILNLLTKRGCKHVRIRSPQADIIAKELMSRNPEWEGVFIPINLQF